MVKVLDNLSQSLVFITGVRMIQCYMCIHKLYAVQDCIKIYDLLQFQYFFQNILYLT